MKKKPVLCRGIEPTMGLGIYSGQVPKSLPIGLLTVMTCAQKKLSDQFKFELVSEDNCYDTLGAPLTSGGILDHLELQTINPAEYLLISANMSCTAERVKKIIFLYHNAIECHRPFKTIAGGLHASDSPDEFLDIDKNIMVLRGEGEKTLPRLLEVLENGKSLDDFPNLSYWKNGEKRHNPAKGLKLTEQELGLLPVPDYSMVKFAKFETYFVEALQRGCGGKCNFCRVKGKCRYFSTEKSLERIENIIQRGGRVIFVVCDHAGEDIGRLKELLLGIIALKQKYRVELHVVLQVRITIAEYPEILELFIKADVKTLCIGFESPIAEDLKAMEKPIDPEKMVEQAHTIQKHVAIHYMGMIGYPRSIHGGKPLRKNGRLLSAEELVEIHLEFIRKVNPDSLQPFIFGPLLKTLDRALLARENRIYRDIGFDYYNGFYVLSQPDEGIDPLELQEEVVRLAKRFYSLKNLWSSFWEFQSRIRDPSRILLFVLRRLIGRSITRKFRKSYNRDTAYKSVLATYSMMARRARTA